MRNFMNLVEGVDPFREQDFGDNMNQILAKARDLKSDLGTLYLAPSIEGKMKDAMDTIINYLQDAEQHARKNIR